MRSFLSLAVAGLAGGVILCATPSSADATLPVTTVNTTRYEAWVDVSTSRAFHRWAILKAYCMKPDSSYTQSYAMETEVRVRAEIKLHGCASGTHKVVYAERDLISEGDHITATITEASPNVFGMGMRAR